MNSQLEIERNKQLVLDHYRSTVSQVDFEEIRQQISPEFIDHGAPPGTQPGAEWVTKHVKSFHAAFPDIGIHIEEVMAERDLVTVRATWSGTHQGDYMGFSATQRSIQLKGTVMWRVRDGRIVERWGCLDRLSLMQQLGMIPASPKYDFEQKATRT
jgi:predicted ester cyclase